MLTTIVVLIFLLILYLYYETYKPVQENYNNWSDNDTHALLAPNIPDDPQTTYKIGGKYCKPILEKNIVPIDGKYKFIKQQLMYDGIWKSDRKISDNTETQKWSIKYGSPIEGTYATNKFFHLPEKVMTECTIDRDIYFPDWNRLEIKDRNKYNFDVCDYDKNKNYKKGIMYVEAGV